MQPRESQMPAPAEQEFIPTPERVSQYLERNTQEVMAQMESVEGREKIYRELLSHREDLQKTYPQFNPEGLRRQLDLVGTTLAQKKKFFEQVQAPEKKGIMRRAWERVKGFAKKHPVITTLLVIALVAGGASLAMYLSGMLQLRQAGVVVDVLKKFIQSADPTHVPIGPMDGFNSLDGVPLGK